MISKCDFSYFLVCYEMNKRSFCLLVSYPPWEIIVWEESTPQPRAHYAMVSMISSILSRVLEGEGASRW